MASPEERKRQCETCDAIFYPRATQLRVGHGRFCSQKCNTASRKGMHAPEVTSRRLATMAEKRARGEINYCRGADNPVWKGGSEASKRRWIESGKANDLLRRYRAANPDKVREFARRRAGRKLDRLPYGTLPKLREAQGNRCAICRTPIAKASHLDHILPLARGGKHEPGNIQLLCPPCNLHKSDRDPIVHMQSLGRLL